MLEKLNRVNYLFDFYENILTARQQEVFVLYYFDNLSLGEISQKCGISRQGVHDLLKRSVETLESHESRMGLLKSYLFRRDKLNEARDILEAGVFLPAQTGLVPELQKLARLINELIIENERA